MTFILRQMMFKAKSVKQLNNKANIKISSFLNLFFLNNSNILCLQEENMRVFFTKELFISIYVVYILLY